MSSVGMNIGENQILHIILVKIVGPAHKERMTDDLFRGALKPGLGIPKAVLRTEIRNAAFGRYAGAPEKYDSMTVINDLSQFFVHIIFLP